MSERGLGEIARLLAESFTLMAARMPSGHELLRRELGGWEVALDIDDEQLALHFDPDCIEVRSRMDGSAAMVVSSAAGILAVIDAEVTLAEAVERDLVFVRGTLDQLERLHAGLLIYLHAAVRCPGFPALLVRLRRYAALRERPPSESPIASA